MRRWTAGVLPKYIEILLAEFNGKDVIETQEVRKFCREARIPINVGYVFIRMMKATGEYLNPVRGIFIRKSVLDTVKKILTSDENSELALAVKSEYVRTRSAALFSGRQKSADALALVSAVKVYTKCREHLKCAERGDANGGANP